MTRLVRLNNANPVTAFNVALNAAYQRSINAGKSREDHFVRELISNQTLRDLNTAAADSYDENINVVRFFGGFLHGRPWASFTAKDNGAGTKPCRRELADALVVFQLTQQDGLGGHQVVRRSACLLMFKPTATNPPTTPSFIPKGAALPNGSDEEQFYLFNQWPSFSLHISNKTPLPGSGSYSLANGLLPPTNIGKYATLWSPKIALPNPPFNCWGYADPQPALQVNDSIGDLLTLIADADPNTGADYDPVAPATPWDQLIVDLHSFVDAHNWIGSRAANPAGLGFLRATEIISESMGTLLQHARSIGAPPFFPYLSWQSALFSSRKNGYLPDEDAADDIFPVLFVTASDFRPREEETLTPLDSRQAGSRKAARQLYDLRRGLW